jgi:hypothetical protein
MRVPPTHRAAEVAEGLSSWSVTAIGHLRPHNGREGETVIEGIALGAGLVLCATAIVYGLQVRAETHERDRLRRFQEAMRAGGRGQPLPKKED